MDKYEKSHLNPCFPFDNLSFSFVDVCHTMSWCWSISADFTIPYETEATKAKLLKKKKTSANRSLIITTVRSSLTWQVDPKFHKRYWRDHLMWKYFPPLHIEIPDTVSGHISSFFLFDPMNFYEYHHSPAQNVHKLVRAREHDTGEFRRCGITPWLHCHLNLSRF